MPDATAASVAPAGGIVAVAALVTANAFAAAAGFDPIGQVETLQGAAFVQRNDGTTETLAIGTKVYEGDVVRTEDGSTLGITFADGTIRHDGQWIDDEPVPAKLERVNDRGC